MANLDEIAKSIIRDRALVLRVAGNRVAYGAYAMLIGKEISTAQSVIFQNVPNRRFSEAMLLSTCSRYDFGEHIERAFTLIRNPESR